MKIALINDTHFGARGSNPVFSEYFKTFYKNIFFPYLDQHNIKTIVHLGDLVDHKKYINYVTCKDMHECFFNQAFRRKITVHGIVGNHDSFYKNTLEVNALSELIARRDIDLYKNNDSLIKIYTTATEVDFDGTKIILVPWLCDNNREESETLIKKTKSQILMGHLELAGFPMYKGTPLSEHGTLDRELLNKFDQVFSGHFHTKSTIGNVTYLGSPYEITWSDFNDLRGFNVYDTETREITHIKNPYRKFFKAFYSDKGIDSIDKIMDHRFQMYDKGIVKVIVKDLEHPEWLDVFVSEIEKVATEVTTHDDHHNIDITDTVEVVTQADSTETILRKYCDNANITNKDEVYQCLRDLYTESLSADLSNN